jgi:hypothetical protein
MCGFKQIGKQVELAGLELTVGFLCSFLPMRNLARLRSDLLSVYTLMQSTHSEQGTTLLRGKNSRVQYDRELYTPGTQSCVSDEEPMLSL